MRDDWDQFTWFDTPEFLPVFDEVRDDGSGFVDVMAFARWALAKTFAETEAEVCRALLYGNGTGEPRGFLGQERREPTPAERALAILDPHLRACPLYDAGPPVIYPHTWKGRT